MNSLDSLSPSIPIGHHSWYVVQTASSICTELINVSFYSSANTGVKSIGELDLWLCPYITCPYFTCDFVPTSLVLISLVTLSLLHLSLFHLWLCPYFPNSAEYILLGWFARWVVSGCTTAVLLGASSRICSKQHATPLCSSHLAFSPGISFVVQLYNSSEMATTQKNSHYILSEWSDLHIVVKLLRAVYALLIRMLTSLSVNEILYVNWSTNFNGLTFNEELVTF